LSAQKLIVDDGNIFYQIAPMFEFKESVVSLTFDDSYNNQFLIGMPVLKNHDLPATFYLITSIIDSTVMRLINANMSSKFELSSHTSTHPDLLKIGLTADREEFLSSKLFLKSNFGINSGLTLSYPWGIFDSKVKQIAKEFFMAARSTSPGYNTFLSLDRYSLNIQGFGSGTDASRANSWVNYAIKNHLWLIEMIHGINNEGYSPIDSSDLSDHLDYIKESEENIWCSTVSNVIKYLDESRTTRVECDFCTDYEFNIRADDSLDDEVYNQPLTLRVKIPASWDGISISDVENFKTEAIDNSKFVTFNILPDNKLHKIKPAVLNIPEVDPGFKIVFLSANPFNDCIRLSVEVTKQSDIDISFFDLSGKVLVQQKEKGRSGVVNFFIDTNEISTGMYILKVGNNYEGYYVKKMIKT
jgi:peptidoglycan/xylan/chitin deacetylase (PgdA/CDA1 family)